MTIKDQGKPIQKNVKGCDCHSMGVDNDMQKVIDLKNTAETEPVRQIAEFPFLTDKKGKEFIRERSSVPVEKLTKKRFHKVAGKWNWYFLNREESFIPPAEPSDLLDGAEIIKESSETLVFCRDGLFLKWEKGVSSGFAAELKNRYFSRASRELKTLQRLQSVGFDVTPPVGYGVSGCDCILITRQVPGTVSVMEYICSRYEKGERLTEEFLAGWGAYWGKFLKSGFYFPDFHCGNILYVESEKSFILVDLYGVRKQRKVCADQKGRMIFRQLKDVMEFLSEADLKHVLYHAGIVESEDQYFAFLEFYASEAEKLLQRRVRDFDEHGLRYRPGRKVWNFPETECRELPDEVIAEVWLKDFAWQHHGIPHLHLLERNGNKIKMEKYAGIAPEEAEASLRKRVKIAGYDPETLVYCLNDRGQAAVCDRKVLV